ncbi:ABC1 kinase family protein [Mycobacterium intracellulare]|uniref:ABC1 kinase family protein n=1 Tax=Mycobacterium intracellulare TaxID=1767 RepID=UPI001CD92259|nr:AarF/UbiB family protein [Mycobacterium intracellulare]
MSATPEMSRPTTKDLPEGAEEAFRGPFADGPPASALHIDAPRLDQFGFGELRRLAVIGMVVGFHLAKAIPLAVVRHQRLVTALSEALVDAFVALGPTFVKVGQMINSAPGIFPAPLADASAKCLYKVPPMAAATVHRIIIEDLGSPASQIFRSFDDEPLAAASVAQVHACVLFDGRPAVLKVQRPDIAKRMNADLRILHFLARLASRNAKIASTNIVGVVADLHFVTNQELNFALEADRQTAFRDHLHDFGDNLDITAPEVFWEVCGPRVICMQRMHGRPMDVFALQPDAGVDPELLLRRLLKAWMEAVCVHGPFHGDIHAGNLWVLDDGRVCFLDFGIMGDLPSDWRGLFSDMFETAMIDHDFTRMARSFKAVGAVPASAGSDEDVAAALGPFIESVMSNTLEELSVGESLSGGLEVFEKLGAVIPREMVLVSKQLLYFERYSKAMAPQYNSATDLFLGRNLFPEAIVRKASETGVVLPD